MGILKKPVSYLQTDSRWASVDYSTTGETTNIKESGCGPTSAAMLAETLTGKTITPVDACRWSLKKGYKACKQGTYYAFFKPFFAQYGINCYQFNSSNLYGNSSSSIHDEVFSMVDNGWYFIACMGPGTWTSGGHFVVLYGYDKVANKVYINDPASTKEARTEGNLKTFRSQVKYYFAIDGSEYNKEVLQMSGYAIATFPKDQFSFRMYHNAKKKTWQKIKQETGCYGLINTAYFSLANFDVHSHTMVAGRWLLAPKYHEYGICVDEDGKLTVGTEKEAVYDYTVGLPTCYINGKKSFGYKEHGKNGSSFIGVSESGDVTCLIASKDNGMTTAQCCSDLLNAGCSDIFRFDGSWSSQGSLGPGKDVDPSQERKVAVYLLIYKKGTEPDNIDAGVTIKDIQATLNDKYGFGLVEDGSWGPKSKKAMIKAVQTEINNLYGGNLAVDGSWGDLSKAACPDVKSVTRNNLAWLIQACLIVKGYDLELDGSYGPGCATIIGQFQKANGLNSDKICGPNTMTKLLG